MAGCRRQGARAMKGGVALLTRAQQPFRNDRLQQQQQQLKLAASEVQVISRLLQEVDSEGDQSRVHMAVPIVPELCPCHAAASTRKPAS